MLTGVMHGPYARQITEYHLKFWFVLALDDGLGTRRYELTFGLPPNAAPRARYRGYFGEVAPRYRSNFNNYFPPDDLSPYNLTPFPRFDRDTLADAMASLLQGEDLADAVRLSRFGGLPNLARYGKHGDLL